MSTAASLRDRRIAVARALCAALVLSGCYATTPCTRERCDGKDNDCDGVVDDGFVDGAGQYTSNEHCGGCGVACRSVFPGAAATACQRSDDGASRCVITACPSEQRLTDDGACVPDLSVQCMACDRDADCELFAPGARCVPEGPSAGAGLRCAMPCTNSAACDDGFNCEPSGGQPNLCRSITATCACSEPLIGAEFGCLLRNARGEACAGVQRCGPSGLGECEAALEERCNGEDDDCDGTADEDFLDTRGRYTTMEHCGACGAVCIAPGPFMDARCVADDSGASCEATCQPEYVDVDGLRVTGCECRRMSGPGVVIGADADCDGVIDETPEFIFVSPAGDDANDGGQVERPVRTLARALERGLATSRNVLVARGIYAGPIDLASGVSLLAGYSPDFRERDPALYQVRIEADPADPGAPVLRCSGITAATRIEGLTLLGGDATATGEGSTAVFLDKCGPEVVLADVTVVAGRGASGLPGADSAAKLAPLGFASLEELAGEGGGAGSLGSDPTLACTAASAGAGGQKQCPSGDAGGGDGGAALCADLSIACDNGAATPCGNAGCTDFTDSSGTCDLDAARAIAVMNPEAQAGRGLAAGAPGEAAFASPTNRGLCNFCDDNPSLPRIGGDGADGESGSDGIGGRGCAGLELVDFSRGRASAGNGRDGTGGDDGSGGGGATAGAGFAKIGNTTGSCEDVSGGSGAGGGSGGCAAPGADGGGGGGSSIGVLIRLPDGATEGPDLSSVRVVTSSGGDGGAGGIGAAGGPGGAGGLGGTSQFWCARDGGRGGDGGKGGDGGGGGGGCGGGSYGLYVAGDAADDYIEALRDGAVIEEAGVAGRSGQGGFSPGAAGESGSAGRAETIVVTR